MHFTFGSPYFFLLFCLLPCFFWCKPYPKPYFFAKLSWLRPQHTLFIWELWFKLFIFGFLVFALAQPFVYDALSPQDRKGRDLVLALDASGSMGERGFDENDRMRQKFDINLALAKDFIAKRHDDNMAIVVFGSFAYTASPLTYDLTSLATLLDFTDIGIAGESTAIGDAISQSIRTLSYGEAKNKAIILLTDGYHNAGRISPKTAVAIAKEKKIKIYTIGIGKSSNYDKALLERISTQTHAKHYGASSAKGLEAIYQEINTLEPSKIRSENYLNQQLRISLPLSLAFFLLLLWILLNKRGLV